MQSKSIAPLLILGENAKRELLKIHIKKIKDVQEAKNEINKSLVLILSQYEFSMAPYPGQITAAVNCGTSFRPKLIKATGMTALRAYANERLALSICSADGYKYVLTTSYFVNKENTILLVVDYYQPTLPDKESTNKFFMKYFKNFNNVDLSSFSRIQE